MTQFVVYDSIIFIIYFDNLNICIGENILCKSKYSISKNCCIIPKFIHLEVTERCGLNCPQCYCDLTKRRQLKYDRCIDVIRQASEFGIKEILFTGGEPLFYPYLVEAVAFSAAHGITNSIATSGMTLTYELAERLIEAGMNYFYVSLNGSTGSIHNLSRDRFDASLSSIILLKKIGSWCGINWVARRDNIDDFPNLLNLAKKLDVDHIDILSNKACDDMTLDPEQVRNLAKIIAADRKSGFIGVDYCYPELNKCLLGDHLHPLLKNCIGGRYFMDILSDGSFSPCRHLHTNEQNSSLADYWINSETLKALRKDPMAFERSCRKNIIFEI